jgi:hypothetical protein
VHDPGGEVAPGEVIVLDFQASGVCCGITRVDRKGRDDDLRHVDMDRLHHLRH